MFWNELKVTAKYVADQHQRITPVMDQNLAATTFQGAWTISSYAPSADNNRTYAWAQPPSAQRQLDDDLELPCPVRA